MLWYCVPDGGSESLWSSVSSVISGLLKTQDFYNNFVPFSFLQNSSFVMEENQESNAEASLGKHIRDAFCVSVSY